MWRTRAPEPNSATTAAAARRARAQDERAGSEKNAASRDSSDVAEASLSSESTALGFPFCSNVVRATMESLEPPKWCTARVGEGTCMRLHEW